MDEKKKKEGSKMIGGGGKWINGEDKKKKIEGIKNFLKIRAKWA